MLAERKDYLPVVNILMLQAEADYSTESNEKFDFPSLHFLLHPSLVLLHSTLNWQLQREGTV